MTKVSVIGLFCTGREVSDGQSIKTRIITEELEKALGAQHVRRIDTYGWKKHPVKLFTDSVRAVLQSENVVFMTDAGGIKIFPWLLRGANLFCRHKLHYVVVGAWLVSYLEKQPLIAAFLRRFDTIFVETTVLKEGLERLGFRNVRLMPNCKPLEILPREQLTAAQTEPYRFCTFSRVMREKGIEDAIDAVRAVNQRFGRTVCTLDIYGHVDDSQKDWFDGLRADFSEEIHYRGIIPYAESVDTIKDCHALLFPTRFYTEGIPGTIIDAYAAGVPVISARWESFSDVVDEGITGWGYAFNEPDALTKLVYEAVTAPDTLCHMKENCLKKANDYLPEQVMDILLRELS